jgi:hypothetical protein
MYSTIIDAPRPARFAFPGRTILRQTMRWRLFPSLDKKRQGKAAAAVSKKIHSAEKPFNIRRKCDFAGGDFWLAPALLKDRKCQSPPVTAELYLTRWGGRKLNRDQHWLAGGTR